MTTPDQRLPGCPCCGSDRIRVFHRTSGVPVNSVLLLASRAEARNFPTGAIELGFCENCGFIYNTAFEPALLEYSERYEPTQAYSATFNTWHKALAEQLVERYDLRDKHIVEIGCGKGEFLTLLCELGHNSGTGFDPAYTPPGNGLPVSDRIEFITDLYSPEHDSRAGDFVCCKMTLEHISPAAEFVSMIRQAVGDRSPTRVFFQVPDVRRILLETAFWDIYYEHCSYFSLGSLGRLFRRCDFALLDSARDYDDQYIMIAARPLAGIEDGAEPLDDKAELAGLVDRFAAELEKLRQRWQLTLDDYRRSGKRVVVWGSGSKGVAFLTTLGVVGDIDYVVDINPNRQGYFMPGTGQQIVGPEFLADYRPDTVIVMNPIYRSEIVAELNRLGLEPEVVTP